MSAPWRTAAHGRGGGRDNAQRQQAQVDFTSVLPAPEALPAAMREADRWLLWRSELRNGRRTKVPYRAVNPEAKASSTDPATWAPFDVARASLPFSNCDGLGFALGDGFAGVDLDACLDPNGNLAPWAAEVIAALPPTYTEVSPSGRGVHLYALGELTAGTRRDGIELYGGGRYFTVSARRLGDAPLSLADASSELAALFAGLGGEARGDAPPVAIHRAALTEIDRDWLECLRSGDPDAWALWRGEWEGRYDSQSQADFALLGRLRFYGSTPEEMQRRFRASGLYRQKTDSPRPGGSYLTRSIGRILASEGAPNI